jgi:lipopolysaccharide transport system permease protein
MVLWQVFVEAIQCPLKAVTAAKPLLSKVQFPPEAILLSAVGEVLFSFLIRLALLVAVFLWYGLVPPPSAALLPVAVTALLALGFMFGVIITPVGVLYNDVTQALNVVTMFWFFFTPVIYPVRDGGLAGLLARLNPVSPLLIAGRDWLTVGSTTHGTEFVVVSAASVLFLFLGWVFYRISMPHLIARIGN